MADIKEFFERWANEPFVEHENFTNCGQCWVEKIKSDVAKKFMEDGRTNKEDLTPFFAEVNSRWQSTELFKRVEALLKSGKTLDQVEVILRAEGIEL